ncbi:GDSL-like Lipase/Acylhydrolase superfamily protein, putative isoform 2 [Hibiscus syriacus]|uniref:GDSL-like Lipase/Acylhydrolase superfamily protein, putative isoform 2 n=1 Tax=Hibiscus syriacus TaxID=106335 RepID=A0A6A2X2U3_HIBSY|nr:GDSL-like Lipase/Acylhydrolase superfamily protein, putative isoform 2 [Hibiscus syriacus]
MIFSPHSMEVESVVQRSKRLVIEANKARQLLLAPRISQVGSRQEVRWCSPPSGWVKVNTDGAHRSDSGLSACGGVNRDNRGSWLGGFSKTVGMCSVPCYFIFGDSLSDVNNNNKLVTTAKVNYSPYVIDFPQGPTGRFTNGRTIQDIIVQLLDFQEFIPPFATSRGQEILKGVNYASGSAGILNESGQGDQISVNNQLSNHQIIFSTMADMLGECLASKLLRKCIYEVQIGINDYINNYFMPQYYNTSRIFTPHQYVAFLIQQYSRQIKILYNNGARMLALFGIGSIGCTPSAMALYGRNGCFTMANTSCCEIGSDGSLCVPGSEPCEDRSPYVFSDAVHPSEAWNEVTTTQAYGTKSSAQAHPLNIKTMAQLLRNNHDTDGDIWEWQETLVSL